MEEVPLTPDMLVRAVLARQPEGAYTRRLVKLSFLAETAYAADFGRRLSSATYIRDHYGPNSRDLVEAALDLPSEIAACETCESPIETDVSATRFTPTAQCEPELTSQQLGFFDAFMDAHRWETTQNLVDEARRTSLYLLAKFKARLDFDGWIARVQHARADASYMNAIASAFRSKEGDQSFDGILQVREYLKVVQNSDALRPA